MIYSRELDIAEKLGVKNSIKEFPGSKENDIFQIFLVDILMLNYTLFFNHVIIP